MVSRTERHSVVTVVAVMVATLVVGLLAHTGSTQEGGRDAWRPPPPRGPGPPGPPPNSEEVRETIVNKGFVFVDGEYLSPPYEIRRADKGVSINDRPLTCLPPETDFGFRGRGPGPGRGRPGDERRPDDSWRPNDPSRPSEFRRQGDPWRGQVAPLASKLENNSVVLSFADQPMVDFGSGAAYDLLRTLLGKSTSDSSESLADRLPQGFDRDLWNDWISAYQAPPELRRRAAVLIGSFETSEREAAASIAARRRLNTLVHPLSLCGIVVTVLAIGHLLGGRPHAAKSAKGMDTSPEMIRSLNWSLCLAALLSLLDLALTILFGQAGEMRELNPFGTHLIEDTRHLAGLKIGATLPAIGLLWLLRRYKRAQVAAWWICLILTLVAFRWLIYSSNMAA